VAIANIRTSALTPTTVMFHPQDRTNEEGNPPATLPQMKKRRRELDMNLCIFSFFSAFRGNGKSPSLILAQRGFFLLPLLLLSTHDHEAQT
jgi:hypothetical protein